MNIIITGGSRGIGLAIAHRFNEKGNRLLLCARRKATLKEAQAQLLKEEKALVEIFSADLSEEFAVKEFAKYCLGFGPPSILINNAGFYEGGKIASEKPAALQRMIDSNLMSAYRLTRALLPAMTKRQAGHIFNINSVAGLAPYEAGGSYSISKFAMDGFGKNLRHELKGTGIKVTNVYPGAVMTDSWKGFDNSNHRIMEPGDVAEMLYAASRLSPQAVVEEIVMRPQLGDV